MLVEYDNRHGNPNPDLSTDVTVCLDACLTVGGTCEAAVSAWGFELPHAGGVRLP